MPTSMRPARRSRGGPCRIERHCPHTCPAPSTWPAAQAALHPALAGLGPTRCRTPSADRQGRCSVAHQSWRGVGGWVPRHHPPQRRHAGHRPAARARDRPVHYPRPAVCGVWCAVCGCCAHGMRCTPPTTQRSMAPAHPGARPHRMQPPATATGNRQPASIYQRLGRCESHRFHRPVVGKSNSSLTVMVRSNISSTICGPETFDKHDPDIDTNF